MHTTKYLVVKEIGAGQSLLVNTLSGAMDLIESRFVPLLSDPDKIDDAEVVKSLRERGYLFDSPADEEKLLTELYNRYGERPESPVLVVCPTHSCNLRCRYCFESSLVSTSKEMMRPGDIDPLFDAFKKIDPEANRLQLFGGEPLLPATYQVVAEILKKAKKLGFKADVITNGVNINRFIDLIKSYKSLIGSFQVTLDGPKSIHDQRRILASGKGTFDRILKNIGLLLENGINVSVRVNVDAQNIDFLPELADIFAERGWTDLSNFHCAMAPVNDHTGSLDGSNLLTEDVIAKKFLEMRGRHENLSRLNHQLFRSLDHIIKALDFDNPRPSIPRFKYCESNSLECYAFGADGYIYACSETISHHDLAIGTYRPEFELWEERVALWDNRSILTLEKCRDCNIATLCGGGCAYAALAINGSQSEPACQDAKKTVDSYLDSIKDTLIRQIS